MPARLANPSPARQLHVRPCGLRPSRSPHDLVGNLSGRVEGQRLRLVGSGDGFPGAAQHEVVRCRPGIVTGFEFGKVPARGRYAALAGTRNYRNNWLYTSFQWSYALAVNAGVTTLPVKPPFSGMSSGISG